MKRKGKVPVAKQIAWLLLTKDRLKQIQIGEKPALWGSLSDLRPVGTPFSSLEEKWKKKKKKKQPRKISYLLKVESTWKIE